MTQFRSYTWSMAHGLRWYRGAEALLGGLARVDVAELAGLDDRLAVDDHRLDSRRVPLDLVLVHLRG